MATFGNAGNFDTGMWLYNAGMGVFTLSESGYVSKITAGCVVPGGGTCNAKAFIYDDDGSGSAPGTLKGVTAVTELSGAVEMWYDFTFASAVSLTSGNWYLGVVRDTEGSSSVLHNTDTTATYYYGEISYSSPESPCPALTYDDSREFCIYATYTDEGSGISIPLLNHLLLGD